MKKRIKKFSVGQTAKMFAALYFVGAAIFMIPFGLIMFLMGNNQGFPFPWFMFLLLPFLYGLGAFIGGVIFCYLYNFVASKVGGVEVEVE